MQLERERGRCAEQQVWLLAVEEEERRVGAVYGRGGPVGEGNGWLDLTVTPGSLDCFMLPCVAGVLLLACHVLQFAMHTT
jgi:hypothetical protein